MSGRITRIELARRIAFDIPEGAVVNLGIGAPTLVADCLPSDREVILHTENGMLGMGPAPADHAVDPDVINAGKSAVTAVPGASYFHQADSFAMMRGGHVDVCVLGAFEVSEHGDLANWATRDDQAIPAVGGAMDLAVGARHVWVMTDLLTKSGRSKLVATCSLPLTATGCVERVYTDMAIFDVSAEGLALRESFAGNSLTDLERLTGLQIHA